MNKPKYVVSLLSLLLHYSLALCFVGVGVLNNLLYAVGGHDGPLVRKSVEVYDPTTNTWRQVADMNMCRRNAGICLVYKVYMICILVLLVFTSITIYFHCSSTDLGSVID